MAGSTEVATIGNSVVAVDQTNNTIRVWDSTGNQVTQTISAASVGLSGPADVTVSADGHNLYVTGRDSNSIAVFSITAGSTTPLTFLQTLNDGVGGVRGLVQPSDVTVTPDGKYVLVTGELGDSIGVFQRDTATGNLTFVQVVRDLVGGVRGLNGPTSIVFGQTTTNPANGHASITAYVGSLGSSTDLGGLGKFLIDLTTQTPPLSFVTEFQAIEELTVETGAGDDTIRLKAAPSGEVTKTTINSGDGDDTVTVNDFGANTTINLGRGNDHAELRDTTASQTITVHGNEGNDLIEMFSGGASAVTNLYGDAGSDTIVVEHVGENSTTEVFGGDDPDTVRIATGNLPVSATTKAHGDLPNPANPNGAGDTLQIDPKNLASTIEVFDGTNWNVGQPPVRAGTIRTDGHGALTYDTFEGPVGVLTAPIINFTSPTYTIQEGDTLGDPVTSRSRSRALSSTACSGVRCCSRSMAMVVSAMSPGRLLPGLYSMVPWARLIDLGLGDNGRFIIAAQATNGD